MASDRKRLAGFDDGGLLSVVVRSRPWASGFEVAKAWGKDGGGWMTRGETGERTESLAGPGRWRGHRRDAPAAHDIANDVLPLEALGQCLFVIHRVRETPGETAASSTHIENARAVTASWR